LSDHIQVAALSDVGCVRTNNEDNFGYDPANDLYVVCDGMGGMAAGEVASSIACGTVIQTYAAQPAETPVEIRLSLAIRAANDAVCLSGQQAEHKGMGTTLVAAVLTGSKLLIGNVGDSRAYMLKNSACMQLTVDHSYVNELIRVGTLKVEDRHNVDLQGMESVITRAIGASRSVEPDFFAAELQHGDTVLLASDGLTRYVDGQEIADLVDTAQLEASCQKLIDAAKARGGADNVTCILLRYNAPATVDATPATTEAAPSSFESMLAEIEDPPAQSPHVEIEPTPERTEDTAATSITGLS
jgi:serine/threonine protein phosphatase PrpC